MADPVLEAAYRATDYRVDDGPYGTFVLRVGEVCPEVEQVLALHGHVEWAFVTACNPHSEQLPRPENARRMAELEAVCLYQGWPHYQGAGVGRDAVWPPEPSFLIVGVSEDEAAEVARHFEQSAIVVGRTGEPARLVWLD